MTAAEIRKAFFDFFASKNHTIVPSAPIVVKNDPTLMFTNAGMNQFKDYFLGTKAAPNPRVADTQKCLRVSGKHNDLEEVGVDHYHHTMFEMLGNWSFGDPACPEGGYFKAEAIAWSWELLTEVLKIPKDRLYVTVFEGDAKEGLPEDEEAKTEWAKWIAPDRILPGNKKDNFWEMGDTGPCGPCTEIHVDTRSEEERAKGDGASLVNNDHPEVIEIWNNVFIQFERIWKPGMGGAKALWEWEQQNIDLQLSINPDDQNLFKNGRINKHLELTSLIPLKNKHVDTGMGLERLVRVLQGKNSNYDTDIFTGTIAETGKLSGRKYAGTDGKADIAFRVIADHIRAISFTIADGQLPSNTGAGYVIRRILRRAVRYYYSYLDVKQPLLYHLVPLLAAQFETVFPELFKQKDFVAKVVLEEEQAFLRTLEKGLNKVDEFIKEVNKSIIYSLPIIPKGWVGFAKGQLISLKSKSLVEDLVNSGNTISDLESAIENAKSDFVFAGDMVFELYDTYGFPFDLTKLIASEIGLGIDESGFQILMQQQKTRSRAATALETDDWVVLSDEKGEGFVGYSDLKVSAKVLRYRRVSGKGKTQYQVVLDTTPFYAESGGQVGDTGQLIFGEEVIEVVDTKKENDVTVHLVNTLPAEIGLTAEAIVDTERRLNIMYNHTATHLVHAALREVLGKHVAQKGSLVNDEGLRFDFSHFSKMTEEETRKVEQIVNGKIRENIPVVIRTMPKEEALQSGAMALFGEKYGDKVRVVTIDPDFSVELCGGTHVMHTGMIGLFTISAESAVAAGVRRVEALTGPAAFRYLSEGLENLKEIGSILKSKEPVKAVDKLITENAQLKKHIESLEARQLVAVRNELLQKDEIINGIHFIGSIVEVSNADQLKKLAYMLREPGTSPLGGGWEGVVVLCANIDGKSFVAISISENVVAAKGLDAGQLIKQVVAPLIKGGGGGQKTLATAGGQDAGKLDEVVEAIRKLL